MAVLAFPEVSAGVCELHDIYLNVDSIKDSARNKMMTYALVQIRKNNWQVIPAGQEASAWFDQHPSDCDLLRSASNPQPQPEAVQEPAAQETVVAQPQPQVQAQPEPVPTETPGVVAAEAQKATSGAKRVLARFLQLLSGACMLAIMGVFCLGWYENRSLALWMFNQIDQIYWMFLIANAAFLLLCVIFFFWILSRKNIYINDEYVIKKDTGRGIVPFILILLAYAGCLFATTVPALVPLAEYIQILVVWLRYIPMLAGVGLALSIIRKIIGK